MATKQISVKVHYLEDGVNKEIRKFTLDPDVATNYEYLMGRIKVFFTSLLRKDLQLYWKGKEFITFPFSIVDIIILFYLDLNIFCDSNNITEMNDFNIVTSKYDIYKLPIPKIESVK